MDCSINITKGVGKRSVVMDLTLDSTEIKDAISGLLVKKFGLTVEELVKVEVGKFKKKYGSSYGMPQANIKDNGNLKLIVTDHSLAKKIALVLLEEEGFVTSAVLKESKKGKNVLLMGKKDLDMDDEDDVPF